MVLGTRRKWPRPTRQPPETEMLTIFLETRRWYISKPRRRDRDVETETTTLDTCNSNGLEEVYEHIHGGYNPVQ